MAHKKAQGSTSNGRDSNAKRLWVKVFWEQNVVSGNIIVRQKGNKFWAADGVSQGVDFSLFATKDWVVKFFERNKKRYDWRNYKKIYVSVV